MSQPLFRGPLDRPSFLKRSEPLAISGVKTRRITLLAGAMFAAASLANGAVVPLNGSMTASNGAYLCKIDAASGQQFAEAADIPTSEKLALAWAAYLRDLNKTLPGPLARAARHFWSDLSRKADVPIPRAAPTGDQAFTMAWDDASRYCEIKIHGDGRYEWFYCDRAADEDDGNEGSREQALVATAEYLDRLSIS